MNKEDHQQLSGRTQMTGGYSCKSCMMSIMTRSLKANNFYRENCIYKLLGRKENCSIISGTALRICLWKLAAYQREIGTEAKEWAPRNRNKGAEGHQIAQSQLRASAGCWRKNHCSQQAKFTFSLPKQMTFTSQCISKSELAECDGLP